MAALLYNIFFSVVSLDTDHLVLFSFISLFIANLYVFSTATRISNSSHLYYLRLTLLAMLFCAAVAIYTWIAAYTRELFDYELLLGAFNSLRVSMPFVLFFQYTSALFVVNFFSHQYIVTGFNKLVGGVLFIASVYILSQMLLKSDNPILPLCSESLVMAFCYVLLIVHIVYSLMRTCLQIQRMGLPKILLSQRGALFCLSSLLILNIFFLARNTATRLGYAPSLQPQLVVFSFALFLIAAYWLVLNVHRYRFLNINTNMQIRKSNRELSTALRSAFRLDSAQSISELQAITRLFFQESFKLKEHDVLLHIRPIDQSEQSALAKQQQSKSWNRIEITETYLKRTSSIPKVEAALCEKGILNYHEMDYDIFYEPNDETSELLGFMRRITVDLIVPVTHNNELLGYILVTADARKSGLYDAMDCKEMKLYASYIGQAIHGIRTAPTSEQVKTNSSLKRELRNIQRITGMQYTVLRAFKKHASNRMIGQIIYNGHSYTFGNTYTQTLCDVELDNLGDPFMHTLTELVRKALKYKDSHSANVRNKVGEPLRAEAVHCTESLVFITVVPVAMHKELLRHEHDIDQEDWFFVQCLESTLQGRHLQDLYPSNTLTMVSVKAQLLRIAFSDKPLFITAPQADMRPLIHTLTMIIHDGSEPYEVEEVDGRKYADNGTGLQTLLFGTSVRDKANNTVPLLQQRSHGGILLLKNAQYLDNDTQRLLYNFIESGMYHVNGGQNLAASACRVILPIDPDWSMEEFERMLIPELFSLIQTCHVTIPNLIELTPAQRAETIDAIDALNIRLTRTRLLKPEQRAELINNIPTSSTELTTAVQRLKKSNPSTNQDFKPLFRGVFALQHSIEDLIAGGTASLADRASFLRMMQDMGSIRAIADAIGVTEMTVYRYAEKHRRKTDNKKTGTSPKPRKTKIKLQQSVE